MKDLKIVSQAQYIYFQTRLSYMHERGLDKDPRTGFDRDTLLAALRAVNPADLPNKASAAPKAKPTTAKPQPASGQLRFPSAGYGTVSEVLVLNRVQLSDAQRQAVNQIGYLVQLPGVGIIGLVHDAARKERLKALFKSLRVLTKAEAAFVAIGEERASKLRDIAELLASPAPAEATPPVPKPRAKWVDVGYEDDGDEFAL